MKQHSKVFLTLIVFATVTSSLLSAHTTALPEARNLTENPFNQAKARVAVNEETIHVVWEDHRFASEAGSDIYYRRSSDGGKTWEPPVRLTSDRANQKNPDIAAYGDLVYVAWEDHRNLATAGSEIYVRCSVDGGATWKAEEQVSRSPERSDKANQWDPRIAAFDKYIHLTWLDERNMATAGYDIYYRRSTTSGVSWEAEQRLTSNQYDQWRQSIAVNQLYVYVVYEDHRAWRYPPGSSAGTQIYYARSTDGGASWLTENRLPTNGTWQLYPDVAASGSFVYVSWSDGRLFSKAKTDIWFIRSMDYGGTWINETRITDDVEIQAYPRIAAAGKDVHIVWQDLRNEKTAGMDLYYRKSEFYGSDWQPEARLTENQWQYSPAVATLDEQVYIVWTDEIVYSTNGQEVFYSSR